MGFPQEFEKFDEENHGKFPQEFDGFPWFSSTDDGRNFPFAGHLWFFRAGLRRADVAHRGCHHQNAHRSGANRLRNSPWYHKLCPMKRCATHQFDDLQMETPWDDLKIGSKIEATNRQYLASGRGPRVPGCSKSFRIDFLTGSCSSC